ncbi:MAG TPA: SgcJ/EcaC family oxidoreductase [Thermoanaerobaculia bacterium]|nr:SgcJ/EcaC family oxidoreductase [Thermoanaerobaculia bacterium]
MRISRAFRLALSITAALALLLSRAASAESRALSSSDEAKIQAVLESYRQAWLAGDAEGVLRLFTREAVLLPHHGVEPVVGIEAVRAFWFPPGPPVTVTELTQIVDQIGGSCDLAYVRGHSRVTWITGKGIDAKTSSNAGTNLTLLRRETDGSWRITHQMWDDPLPRTN